MVQSGRSEGGGGGGDDGGGVDVGGVYGMEKDLEPKTMKPGNSLRV